MNDNKANNIKDIIKEYKKYIKIYDNFQDKLDENYKHKPLLRFLYGPLILTMFDNLKNKNTEEISFLLKNISNGEIIQIPPKEEIIVNDSEILDGINTFLNNCLNLNKLNLENIFEKNIIKNKKKGIYRAPIIDNIYIYLIKLYIKLTGNIPLSNTVLVCNEFTKTEEIKAFLYLSTNCDYNILFCILGIEKMDLETKLKLLKLIKKLGNNKINSCLIILYDKDGDMNDHLCNIISNDKMIFLGREELENIKYKNKDFEIFSSKNTGYGKSMKIKEKIIKIERKNYIYFPLGGEFNREEIIKRLINLNLPQNSLKDYAIHLDLNETYLFNLLEEILFKILFLKKLDINEYIFYFGNDLEIKIELPNSFFKYSDKFPLLTLFKNIDIKELPPLLKEKITTIGESEIQIVANTLKMYEKNYGGIGDKNIDLKSTLLLSEKECQIIINKYINQNDRDYYEQVYGNDYKQKENDYNYYQKMNFIKFLSHEFKKFNEFEIFNPQNDTVFSDKNPNHYTKEQLSNKRKNIIKYILNTALYFTKGPYDKLISSQNSSLFKYPNYDEKRINAKALESLENLDENITFDKIPNVLFIFNNDLSTFTSIPKETVSKEYIEFSELINSLSNYNKSNPFKLPDYSNGTHHFYLNELKKILGLPEKFEKNEIDKLNDKLKELKEELNENIYDPDINKDRKLYMEKLSKINGNYIYTKDNFIKTVIILLKIKANIPVILMGETGCGKTSLLKMLSIFMNKGTDKMKILNIHAGINDNDIIEFINDIEYNLPYEFKDELDELENNIKNFRGEKKYKKEYEDEQKKIIDEKKIWVFFDELNTCNSMGLITEIICKRTMLGKPLSDKLLFLGAVNPYRVMTTKMMRSGLTYKNDNIYHKPLVYTINPLPHTLLNYVFNFGNLNENEEKCYIRAMIEGNILTFYPIKNEENKNFMDLILESICECHNFVKQNCDISAVSLREIRRFNIFFYFFIDYLSNKSKFKNDYIEKSDKIFYSLNITLYLCYYIRISNKQLRRELVEKLSDILGKYFKIKSEIECKVESKDKDEKKEKNEIKTEFQTEYGEIEIETGLNTKFHFLRNAK